jgi:hypothetical protein
MHSNKMEVRQSGSISGQRRLEDRSPDEDPIAVEKARFGRWTPATNFNWERRFVRSG